MATLNFGRTRVVTAPSPATSGLSFTVTDGTGANRLGTGPVVLAPHGTDPEDLADVAEIATISAVSGDTITLSARAVEGTTARAVAAGWDVIQGLTRGGLDAELALLIPRGTTTLATSLIQLLRVNIPDDGSDSSTWPDRIACYYNHPTNGLTRTGYLNEYGELRGSSAKATTVAFRIKAHANNTTTNLVEVTDDLQTTTYFAVSKAAITLGVPLVGQNAPADKIRTSDATAINNSTALVTDATMQFAATAGTYIVEGAIFYDCAAAADLKLRFNYSGTGTGVFAGNALTTAATSSATNQSNHASRDLNSNFACGGYGVGSVAGFLFRGIFTPTGSGTFSVQYAQNTQDASDLVIKAGSHITYRRAA